MVAPLAVWAKSRTCRQLNKANQRNTTQHDIHVCSSRDVFEVVSGMLGHLLSGMLDYLLVQGIVLPNSCGMKSCVIEMKDM